MSNQSQSDELQRSTTGSTRNLGQKDAQEERQSEEELRHMGDSERKKGSARDRAKLGQKDAEREKSSDKKLGAMKGRKKGK